MMSVILFIKSLNCALSDHLIIKDNFYLIIEWEAAPIWLKTIKVNWSVDFLFGSRLLLHYLEYEYE